MTKFNHAVPSANNLLARIGRRLPALGSSLLLALAMNGAVLFDSSPAMAARGPRILKFAGIPMNQASMIRKRFPFVFEREVTLAEVDEIVRFLMSTGNFAGVEVIERDAPAGTGRELVLNANILRKIQGIKVEGNGALSDSRVLEILNISQNQAFERKNLLGSAGDLAKVYETMGFHDANVEIDFSTPNESEVSILVVIREGKPLRVNEVVIDTTNPDLQKRLAGFARSMRNRILTEDELLEFQKRVSEFLQSNRYLTARLGSPAIAYNNDRSAAKLTYAVENPHKFDFRIDGNSFFQDGTIIRQLESDRLAGAVSSPAPDMADRIRRMYQGSGFANVEVQYTDKLDPQGRYRHVRFQIDEGKRVRINRIDVEGNVSRPPSYYSQFIRTTSSDLIGKGFYNRKDIEDSSKRLVTELQNQGFLRAKIQSSRAEYSKDKSSVTLHLNIDEGPLTQIRQIKLEGVESYPKSQILDLIKIKSGSALSLRDLEETITILKDFYRSEGFLEMRILNESEQSRIVTYNEANTQATVEFKIFEGPRVVVGSVSVDGNTFTKDYVIIRELAFSPGEVLTPEKLDESVFRLQKLGLFSQVSIRSLEEGTSLAERTIIVRIVERDPGLFTVGFGLNNERQLTFRGYLGVAYRNIGGTGRAVSFRVDPRYSTDPRISFIEHAITASYLEPYILGDRNRGRINLLREQRFSGEFTTDGRTEMHEENAIGFLLERDLTRHTKLIYTAWSLSNQRKFDRASNDTFEIQNIAKTGPLFEIDYRNDVFNPSRGSYSLLNVEYSDPALGSSDDDNQLIQFVKTSAAVTHYQPLILPRWLVWANHLRAGYMKNLSDSPNSGVPYQEAFFLGGRSTIRGFDPANEIERIPNKFDLGVSELRDFRVREDTYFYLVKTEFRFPIWRSFFLGELGGALFYDGGAVVINQPGVNLTGSYRHSAGIGLRVATPVGPLNLEVGWKLDPREVRVSPQEVRRESPWAFHFSIGVF